jgi:hypothetical protein
VKLLPQEIAKKFGCCRDIITAAVKHWYSSGDCQCLMADQGNDLGVENLDVLKRQHPCLFF